MTLGYALNLGSDLRTDESFITWYRCTDGQGANPLKVAVSRRKPEIAYTLSEGDVGSYLMAAIQPKHSVSEAGPVQTVYSRSAVAKDDMKIHAIDTDFQNLPTDSQPKILPGTWTLDGYAAPETGRNNTPGFAAIPTPGPMAPARPVPSITMASTRPPAARALFYTPAGDKHDDMTVRANLRPTRTPARALVLRPTNSWTSTSSMTWRPTPVTVCGFIA